MAGDHLTVFGVFNGNHISGFGCTAAATTAAATGGGTAARGGAANLNVDSLFNDYVGICIYCRANQGHFAVLVAKAQDVSVNNGIGIVLFQCPADGCRISLQFIRAEFLLELIKGFYNGFC